MSWHFFVFLPERLEQDVKRLKADLQANRQLESELRSQLSSLSSQDRSLRSELGQLRQDNELLQNKWVHLMVALTTVVPHVVTQQMAFSHQCSGIFIWLLKDYVVIKDRSRMLCFDDC